MPYTANAPNPPSMQGTQIWEFLHLWTRSGTAQYIRAQQGTEDHSTDIGAQQGTAQQSTAQQGTAQHS